MLRQLNPYLAKPFRLEQVVSGLAGLRPLVAAGEAHGTKELIRDHEVEVDEASGLISILGGKWTTHRLMAEDTINTVQKSTGSGITEAVTRGHLLVGADGFSADYWKTLAARYALEKRQLGTWRKNLERARRMFWSLRARMPNSANFS